MCPLYPRGCPFYPQGVSYSSPPCPDNPQGGAQLVTGDEPVPLPYSLFIDFNNALNSVPHGTLWTVLERANCSASTISLIKQLYSFPQDSPIINGRTPHAHLQTRGLRQGCPLSPLLFILYLNSLFHHFFATVPPPRANARTSHHAYIDDILIRSEDVNYVQNSLNYFDEPARDWGLDMNVSKTEVHANGTAPQKEFLTPRGSGFHT